MMMVTINDHIQSSTDSIDQDMLPLWTDQDMLPLSCDCYKKRITLHTAVTTSSCP